MAGQPIRADHDDEVHVLKGGLRAMIANYGARLVALEVPRPGGSAVDVVLGYARPADYRADRSTYFGAIVGRYANRIAGGRCVIEGIEYALEPNDGPNTLHGGPVGFDARVWSAISVETASARYRLTSPDGDQGFPGRVDVDVTYAIEPGPGLRIDYEARTDRATVLNLTNHAYFNLAGEGSGPIDDHILSIAATSYLPVDAELIPTGDLAPVAGTPFDFLAPCSIGARISDPHPQLALAHGYDHAFALDGGVTAAPRVGAVLGSPASGIEMTVLTTQPSLQLYTGQQLDGRAVGKSGKSYGPRSGLCLETQFFPDSPNHPSFPSTILMPGDVFRSTTVYRFSVRGG